MVFDRIMMVIGVITIVIAAILGLRKESDRLEHQIDSLVPVDGQYQVIDENTFLCTRGEDIGNVTGYITIETTDGYSGPLEVAVFVDTSGNVLDLEVVSHKETPTYFRKVMKMQFLRNLIGKSYSDPFVAGDDFDAISGATYTSAGIANAVRTGTQKIAASQLGLPAIEPVPVKIRFGIPEITLIVLYLLVLVGLQAKKRIKKVIRWTTMIIGLVILGFWFSVPLSLGKVNLFLLGYWPQWQTNLYWYILIFSVFGLIMINGKKWYCNWFCPFLTVQECFALIGGGKVRIPRKMQYGFAMFQRILAWLAIVLAFYYRTPSQLNFEVFGAFFNLTGSVFLFVLLALFLLASLFIKRPYCHILCPVNALNDMMLELRKVISGK